jgi:hypothetical protein
METVVTSEIRWFLPGARLDEYREWFERVGDPSFVTLEPPRVDHYVALPPNDFVSVKLRGGNLEVKQRSSRYRRNAWDGRIEGRSANWTKTVLVLADSDRGVSGSSSTWIPVGKDRAFRKYRAESDRVTPVKGDRQIDSGCVLELTQTTDMISIAFEAFGRPGDVATILSATATQVFADAAPPRLPLELSEDYPAWLARLKPSETEDSTS